MLLLAGVLAFQRPDTKPEMMAQPSRSQATSRPSPVPDAVLPSGEPTPYEPEPTSLADLGIERPAEPATGDVEAAAPVAAPRSSSSEPEPRRTGDGWLVAPGTSATIGSGSVRRFTVEVEDATGLDPSVIAAEVESILFDPRSWISTGQFAFERVPDPSLASIRVVVATPATVDRWCAMVGLNTGGWLSCQVHQRAMLNVDRWRSGVTAFGGDLASYRAYLVNHEVGHVLGYRHVGCPREGVLAPVMMQQSKTVGACRPNGWVDPDAG